jgi:protein-disulfide isomerase
VPLLRTSISNRQACAETLRQALIVCIPQLSLDPAAETAEFAGANGKFWGMHDLIYENQERLGDEELLPELAKQLHLAPAKLLDALESKEFEPRVKSDFSSGVRSGVNGTPTFFINGQRHDGPYDFASLVEAIDAALE